MRIFKHQRFHLLILTLCAFESLAQSASPVLGPPPPTGDSYKTIPMSVVLDLFEFELHESLKEINAIIDHQKENTGVSTQLRFTYKAAQPFLTATNFTNQPNHYYIRMPFIISYEIKDLQWQKLTFPTRKIHQFVDLVVSCQNWFTDKGRLKFNLEIQEPYADDRPTAIQPLNFYVENTLISLIDSKIKNNLSKLFEQSNVPNAACSCLSVMPGKNQQDHYKDSEIRYNLPAPLPAEAEYMELSLLNIRRLYARNYPDGDILFHPEEDIELEFYANHTKKVIQLNKIREDQEILFNTNKILITKPHDNEALICIANLNIKDLKIPKTLTQTLVFNKYENFGSGYHKIIFTKSHYLKLPPLPDGKISKPYEMKIPAYELTVRIKNTQPEVLARSN